MKDICRDWQWEVMTFVTEAGGCEEAKAEISLRGQRH